LMTVRDLPLSAIAISAGFAHQSHFTRVFSAAVGVSPGVWRREAHGVPEIATGSGAADASMGAA
jgi:AraC family transcriptional regulator